MFDNFKCRICGNNNYFEFGQSGYMCSKCSVVFSRPEHFTLHRMLKIKYLDNYKLKEWGELDYAHETDSGLDLRACIEEPVKLMPYSEAKFTYPEKLFCKIPFGISIELTESDMDAKIYNRSGLSSKHGVGIRNRVGVIDFAYKGELMGFFINEGTSPYTIEPGEKVSQLVVEKRIDVKPVKVSQLSDTVRGDSGFGSTGKI